MNKKFWYAISVIIPVAIGAFAWYQFTFVTWPTIEKLTEEKFDWKTYRNEEWGFEIKHPGNVRPEVAPNVQNDPRFSVQFADNNVRYFNVTIFGGEENMEGQIRLYTIENTEREILIDGVEGSQFYVDNMEEGAPDILNALARNRDRLYVFTSFRGQEELFNRMLGTFRFIERAGTAPAPTPSPRTELTRETALALLNLPTECRAEGVPGQYRSCSIEITKTDDLSRANVVVIFDGQYDDSVRATKVEASMQFLGRGERWSIEPGTQIVTTYRCQPGRGQQDFAATLCS